MARPKKNGSLGGTFVPGKGRAMKHGHKGRGTKVHGRHDSPRRTSSKRITFR